MGTVHRESGFTFRIWSDDHEPPHVHVWKAGSETAIRISTREVTAAAGMRGKDIVAAIRIVAANEEKLLRMWREIHERADRR